jgi:hypothetical protein
MKSVGVIEKQVEWAQARSFFYWRLRPPQAASRCGEGRPWSQGARSIGGNWNYEAMVLGDPDHVTRTLGRRQSRAERQNVKQMISQVLGL